jgi:ribosomal protein L37AE/L43A
MGLTGCSLPLDLNSQIDYTRIRGEGAMCTVGGGPDIGNIESLAAKDYECLDCKNKFKAMGRKPMCPSCKSRNVKSA